MGAKNRRKNLHKHPGPPFQIRGGPGSFSIAQISHSSLVQIIHALVALPLDAGIICTSDLWEIQNTLLIIRDSLRSSSHDIVGYFLPATRH